MSLPEKTKPCIEPSSRRSLESSVTTPPSVWREAQTGITLGKKATRHLEEKMSTEAEMCGEQGSQTANHTFSRGGSDFRLPVYQPVSDCEGALCPAEAALSNQI